ncbi:pyrroline-5-carboxylate reductase [Gracilibacillus boraciitolerans JCM 21714]|uniref:Pyrroline-5-carboxylate reductase n=1 Tax=Gracilibacillus boraciitolerans JCM 21714 TaxID=1298598 RepID=W4VM12_9BACI|nr:pyrroline-5-carboxylate reductase [Gracilibacillus boraciitolerans]GAE93809.1 pyrroline-5-carboxylate reductase [Gracilibacillus boraciitolerans JCM 21714]
MRETIAFLGAGSMAEAIISGMTANKIVSTQQIIATNRSNQKRLLELEGTYHIKTSLDKKEVIEQSDILILAMKPKDIKVAIAEIKSLLTENKIIVSLLAGISTGFIQQQLATKNPIVRVMPNTSAMIGQSATTITSGKYASAEHVHLIEKLMTSIGTTIVIKEEDMDAFTALAGSGPAFYYYMVEAMEQFVEAKGLDKEIAKPLMVQTIKGAAAMLEASHDSPKVLREKITSPGGTTETGINTLSEHRFQAAIIACLEQATLRSKELRDLFEK